MSDEELFALLGCPSYHGPGLKPEQALSLWLAAELRRLSRARLLRCGWSMIPGGRAVGGKLGAMQQGRDVALGYVAGVPDFLLFTGSWCAGLELKAPGGDPVIRNVGGRMVRRTTAPGKLRPSQKLFARWVGDFGMEIETVTTTGAALDALRRWGVLE